jgi:uncharacterized protein DUF1003
MSDHTLSQTLIAAEEHPDDHPAIDNANELHAKKLSPIATICRRIAAGTGTPLALLTAIVVQIAWITVGAATHLDPYPFLFLLTCSNVLQLVMIFVIAVGQRQQSLHDELRADVDHAAISRILYHQQIQESLLLRVAEKVGVDACDIENTLRILTQRNKKASQI